MNDTPTTRPDFPQMPAGHAGCYGDSCPAWMLPDHHPDFVPYRRPTLRRSSGCPGSAPFNWRAGSGKRDSIASQCTRLKHHPRAKTWQGSYPDAPPTGQGPCADSPWLHPDKSFIVQVSRLSPQMPGVVHNPGPGGCGCYGCRRVREQTAGMTAGASRMPQE